VTRVEGDTSTRQQSTRQQSAGVRARARRIWWSSLTGRKGFRSSVRLALIAVYSIVFMWGGFFDWAGWSETVLWSLAAVLWVTIAVVFVRELVRSRSTLQHVRVHPSLPLLLVAPAFLWIVWMPIAAFILVVIAYVLELRHHSAGDGFLFSFGLVLFIGVFAGLSMVEIESEEAESSLRTPSDAIFWAFASLLKINYGRALTPQTEDGRVLATVVGICAILGASLFTAQVVSWVVGSKKDREDEAAEDEAGDRVRETTDREDAILAELAAIRGELADLRTRMDAPGPRPDDGAGGTLST
jgi:hypothetical protein